MRDDWATFGADLHLDLAGAGVRTALEKALRDAVRTGRLPAGTRLPSSRSLAQDLRIARNTVADAYGLLVAEGWLTARQGSGTRVADRALAAAPIRPESPPTAPAVAYDLRPGTPDLSTFPRTAWMAAAKRAMATAPHDAFGYGDLRGRIELRRALVEYLGRARGVRTDPDHAVVCSGFVQGLGLVAEALRSTGVRTIAVESLCFDLHRDVVTARGLRTVPVPVDDYGADTHGLPSTGAGAVLLTPAHQFPTGVPLHPDRRVAAVDWARARGAVIVEDDYDGEFRYDRQHVGALQDLDPDHVVYAGTASKSLVPGVRLAWLAVPPSLLEPVLAAKALADHGSGVLDQLTLAEFISSGAYDRHVRRCRTHYRGRRDRLVAALAARAPHATVTGIAAGLHVLVELPGDAEEVVARAAARGLALDALRRYGDGPDALVVGYGTPPDHAFAGALDTLCDVLP